MKRFCLAFLMVAVGCLFPSCSTSPLEGGGGDPLDGYGRGNANQSPGFTGRAGVDMATEF